MKRLIVICTMLAVVSVCAANILLNNSVESGSSVVGNVDLANVSAFPEPATIVLLCLGGLIFRKRSA